MLGDSHEQSLICRDETHPTFLLLGTTVSKISGFSVFSNSSTRSYAQFASAPNNFDDFVTYLPWFETYDVWRTKTFRLFTRSLCWFLATNTVELQAICGAVVTFPIVILLVGRSIPTEDSHFFRLKMNGNSCEMFARWFSFFSLTILIKHCSQRILL